MGSIAALLVVVGQLITAASASLSYNGLAQTPQMGWDTYNAYGLAYDEDTLTSNAQRIVDLGLRDLGYKVIILDDAMTELSRSSNGSLIANSTRFPSGLKSIGDTFHSMGLEFGVYSSAGKFTCGGYPAGLGYETTDADFYASIGADYLKYDNCYNEGLSGTPKLSQDRYAAMSNALNSTSRNFTYSLCNWGDDKPWEWASTIANSARISGDIFDSFSQPTTSCPCDQDTYYCEIPGYGCSVMNILGKASFIISKNQPGYWNDLDMLEVGNGGMTYDEYKTHFSMWAAIKSPLIMGNNLNTISAQDYAILINPAVLALNQDPRGSAVQRQWREQTPDDVDEFGYGEIQVWSGSLENGDVVVALVNAANSTRTVSSSLLRAFGGVRTNPSVGKAWDVYDLWGNETVMPTEVAEAVLAGNVTLESTGFYYNASEKSFKEGLEESGSNSLLFGTKIGQVQPMGTLEAEVPRHGVGLFRLRDAGAGDAAREEL